MKVTGAVRYRYAKLLKPTGIFFILVLMMSVVALILGKTDNSSKTMIEGIYNFSYYVGIFLAFILGIISYKSDLKFLLQNGTSRQIIHGSFVLSLPINLLIFAGISCLHLVFKLVTRGQSGSIAPQAVGLPIIILVCMTAMSFGYMISAFIYGTKLVTKGVVIGVIALLAMLFELIYVLKMQGDPIVLIYATYCFMFGSLTGFVHLGHMALACILLTTICLSVSHIITNKAEVKK